MGAVGTISVGAMASAMRLTAWVSVARRCCDAAIATRTGGRKPARAERLANAASTVKRSASASSTRAALPRSCERSPNPTFPESASSTSRSEPEPRRAASESVRGASKTSSTRGPASCGLVGRRWPKRHPTPSSAARACARSRRCDACPRATATASEARFGAANDPTGPGK